MITIGNKKFAQTESELLSTLFKAGGTADGFAEVRYTGILFEDLQYRPFAFLVANEGQGPFFVTASRDDRSGRVRYCHGTDTLTERRLGFTEADGFTARRVVAADVWSTHKKG